jgi:inner membrane protein
MVAAQGEVYVQFWLRPGNPPVELALGEDWEGDLTPTALKQHL